jgi:hypothetical protein
MAIFKNTARGGRGILLTSGAMITVPAGETKTVPGEQIKSISAGLIEIDPAEAEPGRVAEGGDEAELPAPPSSLTGLGQTDPLDRDGDGNRGGSLAQEPPALSGMNKAQLIEQAGKEGIIVEQIKGTGANGNVIADDIKAAIEAKRAAKS